MKKKEQKKLSVKFYEFVSRNIATIAVVALCVTMIGMTVCGAEADTLWSTLTTVIEKWVKRLGGVIMFVGGIMFGLGWKRDDADGKSTGISTIIAGAIVFAVAELASIFFA